MDHESYFSFDIIQCIRKQESHIKLQIIELKFLNISTFFHDLGGLHHVWENVNPVALVMHHLLFFQTAVINLSLSTTSPKDTIKIHICVFSPEGKPSEISRVLEGFVEMQKALITFEMRSSFFPIVISDTSTRFL